MTPWLRWTLNQNTRTSAILIACALAGIYLGFCSFEYQERAADGDGARADEAHDESETIPVDGDTQQPETSPPAGETSHPAPCWHCFPMTSNDWTLVVVTITALVIGWQAWETRRAAKAAMLGLPLTRDSLALTRRSLEIANRPSLLLWPLEVSGFDENGLISAKRLTDGELRITNTGSLDITIEFFHANWIVEAVLPTRNPALEADGTMENLIRVRPGAFHRHKLASVDVETYLYNALNNAVESSVSNGPMLFLIGYIKYRDSIGLRRRYFAFRYDPKLHYFLTVDHPGYNYDA